MFQPNYVISGRFLDTSKKIAVLVHKLNEQVLPELLFLELEREARVVSSYASTSIEGNPLPITEVKRLIKTHPKNVRESEQEILNYNEALEILYASLHKNTPFHLSLILDIHKQVTHKLLPAFQCGKLRQEPVFVNDPKKQVTIYWPPDHKDIFKLLSELINFINTEKKQLDPILLAGIFHKQFVILHPFVDGNGRSVRLLTHFLLAGLGIYTLHLFSFERYYNNNVQKYFDMVGVRGNYYDICSHLDFTEWLEYFSDGILDELLRLEKELEKKKLPLHLPLHKDQKAILEYLQQHRIITDALYAKMTDRAKATRSLDFKKLIELGYIEKNGAGKNTYYVQKERNH